MTRTATYVAISIAATLLAACGGNAAQCTLGTSTGCGSGEVCETVQGAMPACFTPIRIEGRITDAVSAAAIAGATIVAIDVNGGARSDVVTSAIDGKYVLPVSAIRNADGTPVVDHVTLRVDAAGHQTFPTAPRTALPLSLTDAMPAADGSARILMNAATDVALVPRPAAGAVATISGRVDADAPGGVLVLAEVGTTAAVTAITDAHGAFTLFDAPVGMVHVAGYRSGLRVTPQDVSLPAAGLSGVVLATATDGLGTVSGSVNIVNAPGASSTSVILVVESTFVPDAARGEAPAGLRAADVTGAFTIMDVPPGRYVVLAAFENDGLVRDPDTAIAGTTIVHIEVPAGGGPVTLPTSFKVTGALDVVSPGATMVDTVTTQTPDLVWADDSSEDGYELRVFDALGNMVKLDTMVPGVSGGGSVHYTLSGVTLQNGMIYQFRALSWRSGHGGAANTYISATEDLKGVFVYHAP